MFPKNNDMRISYKYKLSGSVRFGRQDTSSNATIDSTNSDSLDFTYFLNFGERVRRKYLELRSSDGQSFLKFTCRIYNKF